MASDPATTTTHVGLFKQVWENLQDILPEGYVGLEHCFPFEAKKKIGRNITVPIVASAENGVSKGASGTKITFRDSSTGAVPEATITPNEIFVTSGLLSSTLSQSAAEGAQAVKSASKVSVKSNIKSHWRFLEQDVWYGQDANKLGRIAYTATTFRGASISASGGGTVGGITFTAGVNTSSKHVLIEPADQSIGIWLGSEGMEVEQCLANGTVANLAAGGSANAYGKVVSVDLDNGVIELDFVPVVASGIGSHHLRLRADSTANEMVGFKKIMQNTGTLFGLAVADYSLMRGTTRAAGSKKLSWKFLKRALVLACGKGAEGTIDVTVSFEGWDNLLEDLEALRSLDQSYNPSKLEAGAKEISFTYLNGMVKVRPSRFIRRSDAFGILQGLGHRYGAADVGLKVPGVDKDVLTVPMIDDNEFKYRSYSSSAIFCDAPAQCFYISGIDPEASTFAP
jgi:hypothetical protein